MTQPTGTTRPTIWPKKTRELFHNHFDSTIWNDFQFRPDDIFIATYAKSGTTWLQQIIAQLIFNGQAGLNVSDMSPWVDLRLPPRHILQEMVEAQTHRRFLKTHLPLDALVYNPEARYIYVARDGRDVIWSFFNHHLNMTPEMMADLNAMSADDIEKFHPVDMEIRDYFLRWLEQDGYPLWSYWENITSWWAHRDLPNLMLLHFNQLKADMPEQIRRIAAFLDIPIDENKWPDILTHCSFDYMKQHAENSAPMGGVAWEGGAKTFIHKGTNGRWRDILSADDCARYEEVAREKLGGDCAHWLKTGQLPT